MLTFLLVVELYMITIITSKQEQGCLGHVCRNNGTLEESSCTCLCSAKYSGINCEYELERSHWPPRPFVIPTPIDGCPESYHEGWTEGYMNITTRVELEIWITQNDFKYPLNYNLKYPDTIKFNIVEDRLHIPYSLGPYGRNTFQFNFCYKSKLHSMNSMYRWPSGDYSIYGTEDGCPTGFDVDNITVIIPEVMSLTYDGDLPYMDINFDNEQVNITLSICQRMEGDITNGETFLAKTPFILLKGKVNCTIFEGFNVTSESLQILLLDQTDSKHIIEGTNLQMCYYIPITYIEETIEATNYKYTCQQITSRVVYFQEGYYKIFSMHKQYFNSINSDALILFPDGDIKAFVPAFQSTDRVPWMLLDLKQRTMIESIMIRLFVSFNQLDMIAFELESERNSHLNLPEMYVSNDKWSFLNNGAMLMRKTYTKFDFSLFRVYTFLRRMEAKYLSIVATNYKTDDSVLEYFLKIQQIFVFKECGGDDKEGQNFCLRELGMLGDKLSATSSQKGHPPSFARPYLNGWCADVTDVNPYLQVDLIISTTINGIIVDNGYREVVYEQQEDSVQRGWKSFRLMYGPFQDSMKEYTAVLAISLTSEPQPIIFRKPFLARYVRIYPHSLQYLNNSVCLRLELLGCAKKVILSNQCDKDSIMYATNETNAVVSPGDTSKKISNITGWMDCFDMCMQSVRNCSTLLYRDTDCIMFLPSNTSKYVNYKLANKVDILTTIPCIAEIDVYSPLVTIFYMEYYGVYNEYDSFQITDPGVFTSIGYPYHYFLDQLYMWNISFPDGEYIRLMFTNISLHVYKENMFDVMDECVDVIQIRPRLDKPLLLLSLGSSWNGATPMLPTNFTTLYVEMHTCFRTAEKTVTGIGFRAFVETQVVPNCLTSSPLYITGMDYCLLEKMTFGSASYFGLRITDLAYFWRIYRYGDIRTINLKIIDFDVNCQHGALFSIDYSGKNQSYCNTKRPVGTQHSNYNYMAISYTRPSDDYQYFDGFYAEYSLQPLHNADLFGMPFPTKVLEVPKTSASDKLPSTTTKSKYTKDQIKNGCSDKFQKCYTIIPALERSWQEASKLCWSRGMDLSSIHSQLEFQFLRQALVNFSMENLFPFQDYHKSFWLLPSSVIDPFLYSYIGLRRYRDGTGKQDSLWEDGTPLTFTAWATHRVVEDQTKLCTRMGFHLLNEANTWEPTYCDVHPGTAGYFICQQTYKVLNNETDELQGLRYNIRKLEPASDAVDTLFKCEDGTLITTLSVCDGFPDCFDWSDEENCTGQGDEEWFLCKDGRQIHISYLCNYVHDCYDGSDEFCDFPSCQSAEFQCNNKQCVLNYKMCDAVLDCIDGSDEMSCGRCNTTVSIQCGDLSCVPISQVCDNHVDCSDAADEQWCDIYQSTNLTSCIKVWEAGYRENRTYNLVGGTVVCQFNIQLGDNDTTVKVLTILNDMYIDYNVSYNNGSSHEMKLEGTLLQSFKTEQSCVQKIERVCTPDLLTAAEYDGIYRNLYNMCNCEMRVINYQSDKMQEFKSCSKKDEPTEEVSYLLDTTDKTIRYILHPVVCYSELKVLTKTIKCEGSHNMIPYSRQCLYSSDIMGHIAGCRSLSHLQDCETFECPDMYVKCPNSFCIAVKHICDGTRNCLKGDDEDNCWCHANRQETLIMFYAIDIDETILKAIYKLAQQLYMSSQIVRVLKIKDTTTLQQSLARQLYISDVAINANDERLNRYLSENYIVFSHNLENQLRNSITDKSVGNNIILIQHGQSLVELFQFDETDASKTLYFVVNIDANISKKAEITKKAHITEIKIRKFGDNFIIGPLLLKELCKEPNNSTCTNMYKCASSYVCIHLDQVCDAERDCPYGDDEFTCQFTCPNKCKCSGLVVGCVNVQFKTSDFKNISTDTRALDLSYNNDVNRVSFNTNMTYMYRLNISNCGLQFINRSVFSKLNNLKILDISFNRFETVPTDTFKDLKLLETLNILGNKLLTTIQENAFNGLTEIRELLITGTKLQTVVVETFAGLKLSILNLTYNQISTIEDMAFNDLEVNTIDISGNDVTNFNKDMFTGVRGLQSIYAKAYKFCCIRPSSVYEKDCFPYKDEFSSCEDLMRNNVLQALLWVTGICAILGNGMSFGYRCLKDKKQMKLGFGIFTTNLAVADFLMGVYLLIIAIADTVYRDRYIWNEDYWRNSIWCTMAGVLSTVASEAGVLFVCLITLDRLLVIKFPFGQIRFKTRSAILFSILSWLLVIFIAIFPLMHTEYFKNQFYTKSGVCLALPLTRDRPPGWQYSIAIFVGFNCVTFILISIGQLLIFFEIKRSKQRVNSQSTPRGNDLKIAKNLLLVVATDFMCWFPIGCMGMLALNGHTITGDVYAWTAVFILPINSAINPFLYTLSGILFKSKFVPRIDEQIRTSQSKFLECGKCIMAIWESRIFRPPPTNLTVNTMPLETFVSSNGVTSRDILTIVVQTTCVVRYVHHYNMVLRKLDITNLTAVTLIDRQGLDYVQVQQMPSVCTNKTEKMEDMYDLGVTIRRLLNKCKTEQY